MEEQQAGLLDLPDDLLARILKLAVGAEEEEEAGDRRSAWRDLSVVSRRFRSIVCSPLSGAFADQCWSITSPGYPGPDQHMDVGSWLATQQQRLQRYGSVMRHMHFLDSPHYGQPFEPHVPEQLLVLLPPGALQRLELDIRAEVSQPVLQALPHLAPSLTMLEIRCAGSELSTLPGALLQLPQLRDLVCEGACLPDGMLPAVLALTALNSLHLECWSMDEPLPHCDQLTTLQRLTYLYLKDYTWHYEGEPLRVPAPADFSPALAILHFFPNTYDNGPGGRVFQVGGAQFSVTEYSHDEDGSADFRLKYLRGGGPGALAALLPPGTNKLSLTLEYCELTPELFVGVSRLASLSSLELTRCNEEALVPAVLALLKQAPGLEYLILGEGQRLPGDPSESLLQLVTASPALRGLWETSDDNLYRDSFADSFGDRLLQARPRLCDAYFMGMDDSGSDAYERFQAALAARREAAGSEA